VVKESRLCGRPGPSGVFQQKGVRGICSVEQFHRILREEQERASRSQHEFSLLLFSVNGGGSARLEDLADALVARTRSTDEVGWAYSAEAAAKAGLDGPYLGVVLPCTPDAGARRLAADVCRACSVAGVVPDWSVYTYPSKWFSDDNGNGRQYYFADILPAWGVLESSDCRKSLLAQSDACAALGAGRGPEPICSGNGLKSFLAQSDAIAALGVAAQARASCGAADSASPSAKAGWALTPRSFSGRPLPVWKRAMDIVVAAGGLILLSPFIFLVSVIIKSVSRGPVFFKQNRVGYMGKPFTMWKFRTMKVNCDPSNHKEYITKLINGSAENGEAFGKPMTKLDDDPRIIPFGKILRKTCLDEVPQLINVLRGQMSLVGPRPAIDYEVQVYSAWHYRRLDAVPGVTGLWQVNGKNRLTFNQMVRLDIKYLRERSFWLDVSILLKTPSAVLSQVRDRLQEKQSVTELIVENA